MFLFLCKLTLNRDKIFTQTLPVSSLSFSLKAKHYRDPENGNYQNIQVHTTNDKKGPDFNKNIFRIRNSKQQTRQNQHTLQISESRKQIYLLASYP
jgi:hypothetical protein